ncbi:MAG: N-acetylmuramic acid 6-phosphate etherase [Limnochordales bacterium]|nr:N-acetylmuramic acid 6-phosphate etherase [Limnochordales bacterium]
MKESLEHLTTEARNPLTLDLDTLPTLEILRRINDEDKTVALAVEKELPQIAEAVDKIVAALEQGGRLFYVGAGTSGRLGALDAAELPPTFGTDPELVQAIIAGGAGAFALAAEGAEDDEEAGRNELIHRNVNARDVVVGIAASGRTPFVIGALRQAAAVGAGRIALVCNTDTPLSRLAEITIAPVVGPEVIMGSTRMKAGTAQKLVLNMMSTAVMVRLGRVYSNLMVDMRATNSKLRRRAVRILMLATGCGEEEAANALAAAGNETKVALVMLLARTSRERAVEALCRAGGRVREALKLL